MLEPRGFSPAWATQPDPVKREGKREGGKEGGRKEIQEGANSTAGLFVSLAIVKAGVSCQIGICCSPIEG